MSSILLATSFLLPSIFIKNASCSLQNPIINVYTSYPPNAHVGLPVVVTANIITTTG
jgi:hypothetical protein